MSAPAELLSPQKPAREAEVRHAGRPASWVSPLGHWNWRQPTAWRLFDALLAIGVLIAIMVGTNLNSMPRGLEEFLGTRISIKNVILLTALAWLWPRVLAICGLYSPTRLLTGEGEWPRLAVAGGVAGVFALVFPLTTQSGLVSPWHAVAFGPAIAIAAGVSRAVRRAHIRSGPRARQRQVVLVGSGAIAMRMYRQLMSDVRNNFVIAGFVDSESHPAMAGTGLVHLGTVQDLEMILMHRVVDDVFVGLPVKSRYDEILHCIAACARVGVRASYSGDLFGSGRSVLHPDGRAAPVLSLSHSPRKDQLAVKRAMDIVGATVLLVVLAPLVLVIAVAIKLTSKGPVLFAQDRYGYMKRRFRMFKFRTMVADAEQLHASLESRNDASGPVFKIHNDPRVTRLGNLLRRTSLDELPQLWHVLVGEMSLVGPRPLPTRDVVLFPEPWLMRRFSVHPGLTCLWQIGGRSNLGFDKWIALDLEYIDNWSLWLDVKILMRTLPALIRGTGAV